MLTSAYCRSYLYYLQKLGQKATNNDSFSQVELRVDQHLPAREFLLFTHYFPISKEVKIKPHPSLPEMWSNSCRVGGHGNECGQHLTLWKWVKVVPSPPSQRTLGQDEPVWSEAAE